MTKIIVYRGHNVALSDDVEGVRQATYEIDGEGEVQVECGDMDDLTRIAMRVIDARLDPNYVALMRMALSENQLEEEETDGTTTESEAQQEES